MPTAAEAARRALPIGVQSCWLAVMLGGAGGCDADGIAPGKLPPPGSLCARGGSIRLSEDAATLVSQRATGAGAPRAAADVAGTQLIVYRDDVPTGAGEIILRRASGGEPTFGPPQNLSGSPAESSAPEVAIAGQSVAVVWTEASGDRPGLYLRVSGDAGLTFRPAVRVSTDAGATTRARVAIDADGRIVVVWDGVARPSQASLFPVRSLRAARSTDGGRSFSEAPVLADFAGVGEPALAIGRSGRAFVAWAQQATPEGGQDLMLARTDPDGAAFSPPRFVAGEVVAGAALAVDAAGDLLVLWMPGTTNRGAWEPMGVGLLRSRDEGATFTDLGALDTGPAAGVWLGSDTGGTRTWMAWIACPAGAPCTSRFSRSSDGGATRSPPTEITRAGPGPAAAPLALSAVAGSGEETLLVWGGGGGGALRDLFAEMLVPGRPSSPPVALTTHRDLPAAAVGASASAPVAALPGGERVVVAWSQDANDIPSDHAGIFLARSTDGGRAFSPAVRVADNLPTVELACRRADPGSTVAPTRARVSLATRGPDEIVLAWAEDVVDPAWQGACWLATRPDVHVSRSTDGGLTFSPPLDVSRSSGRSEDPKVAYDSRGGLILVWTELLDEPLAGCSYQNRFHILAARSADGGATFSAPVRLSEQVRPAFCGNASNPVLAVAGDAVFVGWIAQSSAGAGTTEVVAARSSDGGVGFSPARSVIEVPYADGLVSTLAARARGPGDVWLAWKIEEAVWIARSSDGGLTFTVPGRLAGAAVSEAGGLDVTGDPAAAGAWVAWAAPGATEAARDVRLARLADDGAPVALYDLSSNAGDSDWPNVVADAAGNAFVAWQDDTASPGVASILFACQPAAR